MRDLTKRESNLLYGILSVLKTEDTITLQLRDLRYFICRNNKKQNTTEIHNTINRLIEKIDTHKITIQSEDSETLIPLFSIIHKEFNPKTRHIKTLSLKVNKEAQRLFNVLLENNFTQMDISDIKNLNSKYSLCMYEHCIRFSSTGKVVIKYEDFLKELSIPSTYYKSQVKLRCINPIIKDLSKVFKNFKLKIVEEYCRGRMVPTHIVVTFDKFKVIPVDKIDTKNKIDRNSYFKLKMVSKEISKEIKERIKNDLNIDDYKEIQDKIIKTMNKDNKSKKYFIIKKMIKNKNYS